MKNNKHVLEIKNAIKEVSKELGIDPSEVTKRHLDGLISDWSFKRAGGLELVKKAYFPVAEKDLVGIYKAKNTSSYVTKLEQQLGKKGEVEERLLQAITEGLKQLPKPKISKLKIPKTKGESVFVGMLNDTHIGLVVDPEEVGNGNSFDFTEACRRFALYGQQLSSYKSHKKDQKRVLKLILNGDLIAGLIHSLDTKTVHLMIHQVNAAIHIFTHLIGYLLGSFHEIQIEGLAGNHCRAIHKGGGQRAVAEVYDSYSNIIFYSLSAIFKADKRVSFNFPKTPYGFIDLPAGRAMYAHGDHIFSKSLGNPGTAINVKGITGAIKSFNSGEVVKGNPPVKLLLLAHVHTFAHFITDDGVEVYIAPSLVGLDQYAHSLTINNNFIAQVIFESTDKFILGDSRLIRLNEADNNKELDKIIPVYKKELKWSK